MMIATNPHRLAKSRGVLSHFFLRRPNNMYTRVAKRQFCLGWGCSTFIKRLQTTMLFISVSFDCLVFKFVFCQIGCNDFAISASAVYLVRMLFVVK